MAATAPPLPAASKTLDCQTWVLKVSIHCQGCKRKVEKALRKVFGVYTSTIDSQKQKVTVTGIVEVEVLLKKLKKNGRNAEIWHEKLSSGKKTDAGTSSPRDQDDSRSKLGDGSDVERENTGNSTRNNNGGGGEKKKKGQKGNNADSDHSSASARSDTGYGGTNADLNLSPTHRHSVTYLQGSSVVLSSHGIDTSTAYPTGNSAANFCLAPAPSSLYENATAHRAVMPSGLDSLYIFSDENVNGCSII